MLAKTLTLIASLSAQDMTCLAENIYHEARGEPAHGQMMVALVTINRAVDEGGVCDAVWRDSQFSWTSTNVEVTDTVKYLQVLRIAEEAVWTATYDGIDGLPNHYYAHNKVLPKWANDGKNVFVIGNHTFMTIGE